MKNSEQSAFPLSEAIINLIRDGNPTGLSKREYFAAMAMQGMLAGITQFRTEEQMKDIIVNRPNDISELAILYADTLLDQLEKQT